ncbi:hypothetical protein ACK3ZA_10270, partial [Aeromonas caviae]
MKSSNNTHSVKNHLPLPPPENIKPAYSAKKRAGIRRNAVHLSGAALRFTGKRVFDIFTALG